MPELFPCRNSSSEYQSSAAFEEKYLTHVLPGLYVHRYQVIAGFGHIQFENQRNPALPIRSAASRTPPFPFGIFIHDPAGIQKTPVAILPNCRHVLVPIPVYRIKSRVQFRNPEQFLFPSVPLRHKSVSQFRSV